MKVKVKTLRSRIRSSKALNHCTYLTAITATRCIMVGGKPLGKKKKGFQCREESDNVWDPSLFVSDVEEKSSLIYTESFS